MAKKTTIKLADLAMDRMCEARRADDSDAHRRAAIMYKAAMAADAGNDAMVWLRDKLNEAIARMADAETIKDARLAMSWLNRSSLWNDVQDTIQALSAYDAALLHD